MILPSLLEYSDIEFSKKIEKIKQKLEVFQNLTGQTKEIHLHLDFVIENFARDRKVLKSLNPETVLDLLKKSLSDFKLVLSIHLMGDTQDLFESYRFFENYKTNKNWQYLLFVPEKFTNQFQKLEKKESLKIGIWYDLNDWNEDVIKSQEDIKDFLLMTVLAGKSGQRLELETKQKALKIAQSENQKNFILDGGWSLNDNQKIKNLSMVSYSSFWKVFLD